MRSVTTSYQNILVSPITAPAYLVEVHFPSLSYFWSSLETVTYNSNSYSPLSIGVSGLSSDVSSNSSGSLRLASKNGDNDLLTVYALDSTNYGFSNAPIKIYTYDINLVDNGELSEAICLFDGVGNEVSIEPTSVTITLSSLNAMYTYSPRMRCTPAFGFKHLQPKNTVVVWGNDRFTLE